MRLVCNFTNIYYKNLSYETVPAVDTCCADGFTIYQAILTTVMLKASARLDKAVRFLLSDRSAEIKKQDWILSAVSSYSWSYAHDSSGRMS